MLKHYKERKDSAAAACLRLAATLQYARDDTLKEEFKQSKNEYNYYCYKINELKRNRANTEPIKEMLAVFVASTNQLYTRDPALARRLAMISFHLEQGEYEKAHTQLMCFNADRFRDMFNENCMYFVQLAWPIAKHTFLKILQKRF